MAILTSQVVWGVGYTFVSGAAEVWVTDEVVAEAVQPVFTLAHQASLAMTVVGILAAGALGQIALVVPVVAGGIGFVLLAGAMALAMREEGFTPSAAGATTPGPACGPRPRRASGRPDAPR